mmetsp:Transcript_4443/g.12622  ORF Transcript_4443/g.12622 Transcript_4443/m.12622 type:complete len:346 (+) Transcript_4443:922-1959(+)
MTSGCINSVYTKTVRPVRKNAKATVAVATGSSLPLQTAFSARCLRAIDNNTRWTGNSKGANGLKDQKLFIGPMASAATLAASSIFFCSSSSSSSISSWCAFISLIVRSATTFRARPRAHANCCSTGIGRISTCGWRPATALSHRPKVMGGLATDGARPSPNSASLSPRPLNTQIQAKHRIGRCTQDAQATSASIERRGRSYLIRESMAVWAAATAFNTSATASRAWPRMRCVAKGSFSASQGQPPSPNNVNRTFSLTRCPEAVAGVATEARTGAYNTSARALRQAATPPSLQSTLNLTRIAPLDSACVWWAAACRAKGSLATNARHEFASFSPAVSDSTRGNQQS